MSLIHFLARFSSAIAGLVFPQTCVGCGAADRIICEQCMQTLMKASALTHGASGPRALFQYRDPAVRRLIWTLKYRGDSAAATFFAQALHDALAEEIAERILFGEGLPLLVPIPLATKRARQRGFNQMELVAEQLVRLSPDSFEYRPNILSKVKETRPQTSLGRAERTKNLHGTFVVTHPEGIQDRTVILIDDVCTTGSTLTEAVRTLRRAGAREVATFTLAR